MGTIAQEDDQQEREERKFHGFDYSWEFEEYVKKNLMGESEGYEIEDFCRLRFCCRLAAWTRIQWALALRAQLAGLKMVETSLGNEERGVVALPVIGGNTTIRRKGWFGGADVRRASRGRTKHVRQKDGIGGLFQRMVRCPRAI
jgi:hypothetical protein